MRRCAARVLHRGQRAVLWLDWGVFGEDAALHSPLDPKELDAWLRFCRLDLTAACPADRRIVSAVTLDVPKTKQDELRAVLAELRRATARAGEAAFRFAVLPEVGSVPLEELIDYLEDPANTTCPPGMHVDAADAILEATGGVFEGVVDHIREAEETSWHTLLKRLARGGSGAT